MAELMDIVIFREARRAIIAAVCLQGLLVNCDAATERIEEIAKAAVIAADALISELTKEKT